MSVEKETKQRNKAGKLLVMKLQNKCLLIMIIIINLMNILSELKEEISAWCGDLGIPEWGGNVENFKLEQNYRRHLIPV